MKMTSQLVVSLVLAGSTLVTVAQTPTGTHNTWTSGAPMPVATGPAVAVFNNQIYAVGGGVVGGETADTQIYNPATNTWTMGVPLPIGTGGGCAAVVGNTLYYVGGSTGTEWTGAVWVYHPEAKSWSAGNNPMPTARANGGCKVVHDILYVFGGYGNGVFLTSVESYNPVTDTWTEEEPMLSPEAGLPAAGAGTTIVVTDGSDGDADGHNQGYNVTTNTWRWLTPDPVVRQGSCAASIEGRLYAAGGWDVANNTALTSTESFSLSEDAWITLADMPVGTITPGSVAYDGRLYCFGGVSINGGLLNNVQIYQP
jgi:N-acetylneuraminic acid mutarotase